jgi:hypothetical protein
VFTITRVSAQRALALAVRKSAGQPNDLVRTVPTGKAKGASASYATVVPGGSQTVRNFTA